MQENKPFRFTDDQMNGIVEEFFDVVTKAALSLKKETGCPDDVIVRGLNSLASSIERDGIWNNHTSKTISFKSFFS